MKRLMILYLAIAASAGAIDQTDLTEGKWLFDHVGVVINNREPLMPNYAYFIHDPAEMDNIVNLEDQLHSINFQGKDFAQLERIDQAPRPYIYQLETKVYSIPFDFIIHLQHPSGEKIDLFLDTSEDQIKFMYRVKILDQAPFMGSTYMQGILVRER